MKLKKNMTRSYVLCDPTDLIWRKGTLFEAMTGRTAPSSDGLLSEVFRDFLNCYLDLMYNS